MRPKTFLAAAPLFILTACVINVGDSDRRGKESTCEADYKTYEVASQAYFAQNGSYPASDANLVDGGFITSESSNYDVSPTGDGSIVLDPAGTNDCELP